MRKSVFCIALLLGLGLTSPIYAGEVYNRVMSTKKLKVAVLAGNPPAGFVDATGKLVGYDLDVSNELAKRLGATAEFQTPDFDLMTAGKWGGRWDVAVASMTPTDKRAEVIQFPAVYYYETTVAAVNKSNSGVKSPADLNKKKIGILGGSIYEQYLAGTLVPPSRDSPPLKFKIKDAAPVSYGDISASYDDLKLGDGVRLDAVLSSTVSLEAAIKAGYPFRIVEEPLYQHPQAIAVDKGDTEFRDKIAELVAGMRSDGTLSALSVKWFGRDLTNPAN